MNWNDVRFFLAVAREGTLSGGAAVHATSVSRVSRRIEALERDLGLTLFRRSLDGYRLTDAGRALVPRAEAIERAASAFAGTAPSLGGHVRLATSENLALYLVAPALVGFDEAHPGVTVEILSGLRTVDLPRAGVDLALRFTRPTSGNVTVRRLARMACCLYRRAGARTETFIGWPETFADLPSARALAGRDGEVTLTASSLAVQRELAAHGLGRAILPCFIGDGDRRLARDGEPVEAAAQDIWLVVDRDLGASTRVRAVADLLIEAVAARRDEIEGAVPLRAER